MNRIQRLLWEETLMDGIERLQRKSRGATGMKILTSMLLMGMIAIALLATF